MQWEFRFHYWPRHQVDATRYRYKSLNTGLTELRRQSRPFPDPLVKVYDLRTMRPLPPVPFSAGPAFINALPKSSSTVAVTSNQGLINIVDVSNPNTASEFYQVSFTKSSFSKDSELNSSAA